MPWSIENSVVSAELKRFIAEKCRQVRAEGRAPGHFMGALSDSLFTAAEHCDWAAVSQSLQEMYRLMKDPENRSPSAGLVYPVEWAAINEIGAVLGRFAEGEEKYAIAFAGDIIASIAPGSIYFGGTDSGRFLVTALCASHVNADPFFVLTQNALVDSRSYLRYVRGMYSDRIFIPSDRDVADAFKQYQEDARQRHSDGKLSPGERFEDVASIDQLTHQVSIWAINGLLTRLVFDRNTDREFYVEESFPLEWMYPRLTPNGLIMKINRQPLSELDAEIVRRDREFWIGYLAPIVGAWLNHQSNLAEIVEFIERVYLRDELRGFNGDPHYVHNEIPQHSFS
ncbi:MAG TPA: hypothetical protein VL793_01365 [Patescibacteria group bacterium]|nr:hypothetical protein [Patescibacteria group bacterium]